MRSLTRRRDLTSQYGGIETGKNNNYATDEASTRRALDWLKNGAKSRGIDVYMIIGRTIDSVAVETIEGPPSKLAIATGAALGELASAWQKLILSGEKLDDTDLNMAAITSAAFASLVGTMSGDLNLDDDKSCDKFIDGVKALMDENGEAGE